MRKWKKNWIDSIDDFEDDLLKEPTDKELTKDMVERDIAEIARELNKERERLKQEIIDDLDRVADNMDDRQREFVELASALLGEEVENQKVFSSTNITPLDEIRNKFDNEDVWEHKYKTEKLLYIDTAIKLLELDNDGYIKIDQVKVWVPSNYLLTALLSWKDEYEKM